MPGPRARQLRRDLGCGDPLRGEGLAHPGERGRRSGDSATPVLKNRAHHSDLDAIIPFEELKLENNMSDARPEVCSAKCLGRIPTQALGTGIRTCCGTDCARIRSCTRQEATAQQVLRRARRPASQSLLMRRVTGSLHAVGFCESPTKIRRGKRSVANVDGAK